MKNNMNWNFDNSYSRLSNAFKEHIDPVAVKNPELILMNQDLAKELNLDFTSEIFPDQKERSSLGRIFLMS